MAKEENIILPVAAGIGLLILLSDSGPGPGSPAPGPAGITPTIFIKKYWPEAVADYKRTGISPLFTITQAGLESGWGRSAPGYNFFGIHADSSWTGDTILRNDAGRPTLFRAYPSARAGFTDHGMFFFKNPRYKYALPVRNDAVKFAKGIAAAGYAEDPRYAENLISAMKIVLGVLQRYNLV